MQIRIRRNKRRGSIRVDLAKEIKCKRAPKGATQLDVENALYVGGIAEDLWTTLINGKLKYRSRDGASHDKVRKLTCKR